MIAMEKKILAAIASISARSGYGHMGAASPEALLATLRVDRNQFIKAVKGMASAGLVDIDDESGDLTLTAAGSSRVAEDELPPPEPAAYVAKLPETAPPTSRAASQPATDPKPDTTAKLSAAVIGPGDTVTPLAGGKPVLAAPADAGQPSEPPLATQKKQRGRAKTKALAKKGRKT